MASELSLSAIITKELGYGVFERFTERARQVVVLAQEEARNNKCNYIGTEHLLMGVLREEEGLAARVLASLDVTVEKAAKIVNGLSQGEEVEYEGQIPMTPRTKKCLELALREALALGHNYIGTEHVMMGILREGENKALDVLERDFKVSAEKVRSEIIRMLSGPKAPILKEQTPVAQVRREKEQADARKQRKLMEVAVSLGRQYPDRPAEAVVTAVLALHDD